MRVQKMPSKQRILSVRFRRITWIIDGSGRKEKKNERMKSRKWRAGDVICDICECEKAIRMSESLTFCIFDRFKLKLLMLGVFVVAQLLFWCFSFLIRLCFNHNSPLDSFTLLHFSSSLKDSSRSHGKKVLHTG